MDALTESLLPLRYQPDENNEDLVFLVDPPTVRQAIMLYGLMPFADQKTYEARIRKVMGEWLDECGLLYYLDSNNISFETQCELLFALVKSCEPDPEESTELDKSSFWKRDGSLSMLIAEYRHWYHSDVMNEPWPFFLIQARKLERVKAEFGLSNLAWYASGKSEDSFNNLIKRAGYKKELPEMTQQEIDNQSIQLDNASHIGRMMQKRGFA